MLSLQDYQKKIEQAISQIQLAGSPKELYEPINYILSIGGKRIRPSLVLMGCNLFSDEPEKAMDAALAIEIFHNFTLLHDDIMDEAEVRRNQKTVHKKWNNNVAILSGDAMLIKAYQFIEKIPEQYQSKIYPVFNQTALEVCEGQQFDMNFENRQQVSLEEYIQMITLKTAVLVAASLKIGAIIGGADKEDAENLYQFGLNLGLAFQIQDDYLDAFSDEEQFGKAKGGDIMANKKTYLLIHALQLARGNIKTELTKWLNVTDSNREDKVAAVIDIFRQLGIPELAKSKTEFYHHNSLQCLEQVRVEPDRKASLYEFTEILMGRKK